MSRIFHVTVIKEIESTIIAESLEEARKAMEKDDIDDWADAEWEVRVTDSLEFVKRHPQMIPTKFSEPEMGVLGGKAVAFYDYLQKHPDWLEKVEKDVADLRAQLASAEVNQKLPGVE